MDTSSKQKSPFSQVDRVPPHSAEAEIGVLGAALLDGGTVLGLCIERQLSEESFHVPVHRMIFEVMLGLYNANRPLDLLTVGERLKANGILEQVGGQAALNRIVDATPTAAHAEYYIDIVRDNHLRRQVNGPAMVDVKLHFDEQLTRFRDRAHIGVDGARQ